MKIIFTNKVFIISGIIILLITIFVIKSHFDTISWLDFKIEKVYMEKIELDSQHLIIYTHKTASLKNKIMDYEYYKTIFYLYHYINTSFEYFCTDTCL